MLKSPKKSNVTEEQGLLEIFENGTIIGSVSSEVHGVGRLSVESVPSAIGVEAQKASTGSVINCERVNSMTSVTSAQGDSDNSLIINRTIESVQEDCDDSQPDCHPSNQAEDQLHNQLQSDGISTSAAVVEYLNTSDTCSHDSRSSKGARRKRRKKHPQNEIFTNHFPPPYTTIYLDASSQSPVIPSSALNQIRSIDGGHLALSVPVIRRARSTTRLKGCCNGWLSRPSLPFVIGILALGGVACTLGGIVLGSTGLIEHSTQYLSAALLMIGIGVSLLVISGAIWRLSIPDEGESCPCFATTNLENCQNCNSPFCNNRLLPSGFIYPEFQHRPPPPSYLTSVHECTVRVLLAEPPPCSPQPETLRNASPPPSYRSCSRTSLSMVVPIHSISQIQAAGSAENAASGSVDIIESGTQQKDNCLS